MWGSRREQWRRDNWDEMRRRKEEVVGKKKESCKVGGRVKEMKMEAGAVHNSFTKQNKVYYVIFLNRYRCHSSHMLLTSTNTCVMSSNIFLHTQVSSSMLPASCLHESTRWTRLTFLGRFIIKM